MGQIKLMSSLLMVGLFSILIIGYAINFADDNNVAFSISNNTKLINNNNQLITNIKNVQSQGNNTVFSFEKATIKPGDENTESGGYFKSITGMYNAIKNIFNIGKSTFGGDEQGVSPVGLSLTVLGAFISIMGMLYAWKSWRGNPD